MSELFTKISIKKSWLVWLFVCLLIGIGGEIALPTFMAEMLEQGVVQRQENTIFNIALVMGLVALIAFAGNAAVAFLSSKIATIFARDIRKQLFDRVQSFSGQDVDSFGAASLITRTTSDVTKVQSFASLFLQLGVLAPLMLVAGGVLIAVTGGETSAVLIVTVPVLLIGLTAGIMLAAYYSTALRTKLDTINRIFLEILEGVRVIRAFNKQSHEKKRFAEVNADYTETAIKNGRLMGLFMPFIYMIFGLTTAGVMYVGAYYVSRRTITVSALVANSQYVGLILGAIIMAAFIIMMFPGAYASMKRIAEVLKTEPSIKDGEGIEETELTGTVEFKNVTFGYSQSEEPILKDISFSSGPGEMTAIIGATGSGKSSILKLIPRLYDITFGEILVNGRKIKDYKLEQLRDLIGYVPQKNVLFSGDVASNLNFGDENGQQADWERAAEIASAAEFIKGKPDQYHSPISQGGTNLSGGQRQRMAIARAVMKKPQIYLFDDSFSALDMKTDRELRQKLHANLGNSTMVVVAQRISSIMEAERILLVDKGEIVARGTHHELLQQSSMYRELAILQLGEEAVQHELASH